MNILRLIAVTLIVVGFGQMAALVAILYRYAIPRSPRAFHYILIGPMTLSSLMCFALAYIAIGGAEEVFGIPAIVLLFSYFGSEALIWWVLVGYSIYHFWFRPGQPGRAWLRRLLAKLGRQGERPRR